jgi:diacylglycerol kinase (ATP)
MSNIISREFKRVYTAFFYSMAGLTAAWKIDKAFRLDVVVSIVLIPAAFWIGKNAVEIGLLLFTVAVFLLTELLNVSVETIIDRISEEHHELSKLAKDISSTAVFISIIALIVIWGLLIYEKFF